MLVGAGAIAFAREHGLEFADSAYFFTPERWEALQKAKQKETESQHGAVALDADGKFGTVGAVALDADGNIAAATSTGGITNKRWGRVGDSPVIGAGTYADNRTCGVSCSGVGEYFIRAVMAYDVTAQMRYAGRSLEEAVTRVIDGTLTEMAGPDSGGMIALDRDGNVSMVFNTAGMYRGYVRDEGPLCTAIHDEPYRSS
jgi:beta-aspartyl-peptidase (threonine type)